MSEIKIRQTIPDAWAEQGRCPLCAAPRIRVQHPAAGADQLQCAACGVAFEMELDGARLHVCRWPDSLAFLHEMVAYGWMTATELRTLIQQVVPAPAPTSPAAPGRPPIPITPTKAETDPGMQKAAGEAARRPGLSQKPGPHALDATEISIRIKKLRALGNSPKQIRTTLTQAESEPERIQAILGIIVQVERQEQARQGKKLRLSLGIVGVMVLILVGAGLVLQKDYQNKQAAGSALQGTAAPALAKILNLNTPVVKYGAAPPSDSSDSESGCPRTSQKAAALFGGQPANWYSPQNSNGWVMIRQGQATDIYIPGGMTAAYLQLGKSLQLVDVTGPATLSGVYYIAVSCP
jgi:hypothetical protein